MIQMFTSVAERQSIYHYTAVDIKGDSLPLKSFEGKVLLIVNTASECGFTPQYEALEKLYKTYRAQGFEVLAFPSNDFGGQEPLKGVEISNFCEKEYQTTFPIFEKSHVKGPEQNPVFRYLSHKELNGRVGVSPIWNFQKYLVNRKGEVVEYYLPTTSPTSGKVIRQIEKLLHEAQ
jgi:glutathione peroxidase